MKKTNSVKVYWEEFPDDINQLKDALNPSKFQEPSEVLNSTEVSVKPKPWLQKQRKPKLVVGKKNEISKNESVKTVKKGIPVKEQVLHKAARLKDLNPDDKQKIANLIRELAKFGNEKEEAVKQLHEVKDNYTSALKKFQLEKEQAVKKHDLLKEKLLEYEIMVEEMKLSDNNQQSSQNQENLENIDGKSETSLIDNFSELFLEQEKKFHHQQNILQDQIEQLLKLQESILKQQTVDQEGNLTSHKTSFIEFKEIGVNSRKLESYIMAENRHEVSKQDLELSLNQNAHLDKQTLNQHTEENGLIIPSLKESTKKTQDIEVQTEIPTLNQHKQFIDVAEQVQCPLISKSSCHKTPVKTQANSSRIPDLPGNSLKVVDGSARNGTINATKRKFSNTQQNTGFNILKHSLSENEGNQAVLVSPVQRKHFKPSSMLELVEGIQPRSTSTSVDQYSMKQSSSLKTKSSSSNGSVRFSKKSQSDHYSNKKQLLTSSGISAQNTENIYGQKQFKPRSTKQRSKNNEDILERNMLDDIFFT